MARNETLHRFRAREGGEHALSADRAGANLPGGGDRWLYVGEWIAGESGDSFVGHDFPEIAREIEAHGYSIRPEKG